MKLIHCADLHLDSKMQTNLTWQKALERNEELTQTFENLVNFAAKNQVQILIIAGDLFDTEASSNKLLVKRILQSISKNPQITFFYLRGNHDSQNVFRKIENLPENLKFFSSQKWTLYKSKNICVGGREFFNQISNAAYQELKLDENLFNIIILHGQIFSSNNVSSSNLGDKIFSSNEASGADGKNSNDAGNKNFAKKENAPLINLQKLSNKNINYLALGHIHKFSEGELDKIAKNQKVSKWVYSGCLEGRGFDECGKKGFVLLELDEKNNFTQKFIPFAKREFFQIKVDISSLSDFREISSKIENEVQNLNSKNFIKIILCGQIDENTELNLELLKNIFKNRFYFFDIQNQTESKINFQKYENDFSLKGEFVRKVQKSTLSTNEKFEIISTGLKLLSGKEII